jgi:hypothetical protein
MKKMAITPAELLRLRLSQPRMTVAEMQAQLIECQIQRTLRARPQAAKSATSTGINSLPRP